jgi:FtsP/CotA-like multicopper oxidase with cupredoxin domain
MTYLIHLLKSRGVNASNMTWQKISRIAVFFTIIFLSVSGANASNGNNGNNGNNHNYWNDYWEEFWYNYFFDDESGLTPLVYGDIDEGLEDANLGAFEGGVTGTLTDPAINNVIAEEDQRENGLFFNIPTNGPPSPLFGAQPFSQSLLRFEEFGGRKLKKNYNNRTARRLARNPFPSPNDIASGPDSDELDQYLRRQIYPLPTKFSNIWDNNPWQDIIEGYLGRALDNPPAEGRPPGLGWSHQRWNEFKPETYFKTAQAGARENSGFRDRLQRHEYSAGEFGPGGLYHLGGTTDGVEVRLHPDMPLQEENALWTFDGTFPPKLLSARYGEPLVMRHYNALPVDVSANKGFGLHTLSTHEHNGHNPAESDGYTNAFFFPGQYYDYRWPMVLAGTDSINVQATDKRAGMPKDNGGIKKIRGDWHETMSTHWFHDHMLDFTAQNVYKGNAAMMNYYSALDRGNESIEDGVNLRLPSGDALAWGNRDYDVNILLAEKAWDNEGQLWFNPFNQSGFIGDAMTVNWLYKPYMEVRARQYRFRILNASVSRYFKVALVSSSGERVPFHMVANDGNLMEHTVYFENAELPTLGVAERYDIVVDFSQFDEGETLHFVNLLQQRTGQSTDGVIPLEDVVSGVYQAVQVDDNNDGVMDRWYNDPVVGKFMEFRVVAYDGVDNSMRPEDYVEGGLTMIPIQRPTEAQLANATHRTFEFERQPTDEAPWVIETDGGKGFNMDPRRLSAAPSKNSGGLEVWRLLNSGTWSHPIHIHFEEGIILRRNGVAPPEWEKWARKDVYRLGPAEDSGVMVEIALRFREFAGSYMEHCHNTQHEDHAMLLRWDIENPGQTKLMPAPIPSWDGVSYVDSVALPTARTGDGVGQFGPTFDDQGLNIWVDGVTVAGVDLVDVEIGTADEPTDDERVAITLPLTKGLNIDADGNEREVFFVLHDISDEALAESMGIVWGGGLTNTPIAASSPATLSESGVWTFYGDLPNPITRGNAAAHAALDPPECADVGGAAGCLPAQSADNSYSSMRRVNVAGKDVIVNAFFVHWGNESWEQLGIDPNCDPNDPSSFPDDPPNTACRYNGERWGEDTGHTIEINVTADQPYTVMKGHKSWSEGGDYLPYYIIADSYPAGPANNMRVIYVPKHRWIGPSAVPLVQFVPQTPLTGNYPPTTINPYNAQGGGPLGGQIGIPSYFMPQATYSPFWHIGFTNWVKPRNGRIVKSINELKALRATGDIEIREWPAKLFPITDPRYHAADGYNFDSVPADDFGAIPGFFNIVNCPTPITIDTALHKANKLVKAAILANE